MLLIVVGYMWRCSERVEMGVVTIGSKAKDYNAHATGLLQRYWFLKQQTAQKKNKQRFAVAHNLKSPC